MISHAGIKDVLPHRHPMLLVDRVLEVDPGERIVALKNVTANEPCFAGVRDGAPEDAYAYPATLVVESFCQAAGIMYNLLRAQEAAAGDVVMLFGAISSFRFHHDVLPGSTMEHHVRLEKGLADAAVFAGEVRVDGRVVADVDRVVVALRPAEALEPAAAPA